MRSNKSIKYKVNKKRKTKQKGGLTKVDICEINRGGKWNLVTKKCVMDPDATNVSSKVNSRKKSRNIKNANNRAKRIGNHGKMGKNNRFNTTKTKKMLSGYEDRHKLWNGRVSPGYHARSTNTMHSSGKKKHNYEKRFNSQEIKGSTYKYNSKGKAKVSNKPRSYGKTSGRVEHMTKGQLQKVQEEIGLFDIPEKNREKFLCDSRKTLQWQLCKQNSLMNPAKGTDPMGVNRLSQSCIGKHTGLCHPDKDTVWPCPNGSNDCEKGERATTQEWNKYCRVLDNAEVEIVKNAPGSPYKDRGADLYVLKDEWKYLLNPTHKLSAQERKDRQFIWNKFISKNLLKQMRIDDFKGHNAECPWELDGSAGTNGPGTHASKKSSKNIYDKVSYDFIADPDKSTEALPNDQQNQFSNPANQVSTADEHGVNRKLHIDYGLINESDKGECKWSTNEFPTGYSCDQNLISSYANPKGEIAALLKKYPYLENPCPQNSHGKKLVDKISIIGPSTLINSRGKCKGNAWTGHDHKDSLSDLKKKLRGTNYEKMPGR